MTRENLRKAVLVERLADHVLARGLGGASLRPLAAAVGTSDRMLLYYFPDKASLIAAVLGEIATRMTALLAAHVAPTPLPRSALEARLLPLLLDDVAWPYMALWLEIASLAARGDPAFREVGERIGRGFLAWGAAQLDNSEDAGLLMMTIEGAVLLKSLGMEDVVRSALASR